MPRTSQIKGPRLRRNGPVIDDAMMLFLVDGFDLFDDGFAHRLEEMRQAWEANRERICQEAEKMNGRGSKPWAHFAFELGKPALFEKQRRNR